MESFIQQYGLLILIGFVVLFGSGCIISVVRHLKNGIIPNDDKACENIFSFDYLIEQMNNNQFTDGVFLCVGNYKLKKGSLAHLVVLMDIKKCRRNLLKKLSKEDKMAYKLVNKMRHEKDIVSKTERRECKAKC